MGNTDNSHPPLEATIADKLLTQLSSDDAFRKLFSTDPENALIQLGVSEIDAKAALNGKSCLCPVKLAPKEEIAQARDVLLNYLTAKGSHTVVHAFEAGSISSSLRVK